MARKISTTLRRHNAINRNQPVIRSQSAVNRLIFSSSIHMLTPIHTMRSADVGMSTGRRETAPAARHSRQSCAFAWARCREVSSRDAIWTSRDAISESRDASVSRLECQLRSGQCGAEPDHVVGGHLRHVEGRAGCHVDGGDACHVDGLRALVALSTRGPSCSSYSNRREFHSRPQTPAPQSGPSK